MLDHKTVAEKATRFIKRLHGCDIGAFEFQGGWHNKERVDGIAFNSTASFLIEAKVSRSDFLADKRKSFRTNPSDGMGCFRYYACPEGLINPSELPKLWGLIYVQENGQCYLAQGFGGHVRTSRKKPFKCSSWDEHWLIYHGCWGDAGRQFKFVDKNKSAEEKCLFFLAKRYRERKFMENIL